MKNLQEKLESLSLLIEKNNTQYLLVMGFGELDQWSASFGDPHMTELRTSDTMLDDLGSKMRDVVNAELLKREKKLGLEAE